MTLVGYVSGKVESCRMVKKHGSPAHLESQPWLAEGEAKRHLVQGMFDQIAPTYDQLNHLLTFNKDHGWRKKAVQLAEIRTGETVLDLCCGTGDFLPQIRRATGTSGRLIGMDFSLPMLGIAPKKDASAMLAQADAMQIPLRTNSVDVVTVGWGIRNVPNIDQVHQEIFRVLRPGGRFVSVDMAQPKSALIGALSRFVFRRGVPVIGALFGQAKAYKYLPESTQRFHSREELIQSMQRAGFSSSRFVDLFFGNICIHLGVKS